eukprot:6645242-Pyramimonas_sp.AAC.1
MEGRHQAGGSRPSNTSRNPGVHPPVPRTNSRSAVGAPAGTTSPCVEYAPERPGMPPCCATRNKAPQLSKVTHLSHLWKCFAI